MRPNAAYGSDIVIIKEAVGWSVWSQNDIIANVTREGLDLLVYGAVSKGLSVYNEDTEQWLAGTLAQLDPTQEVP